MISRVGHSGDMPWLGSLERLLKTCMRCAGEENMFAGDLIINLTARKEKILKKHA